MNISHIRPSVYSLTEVPTYAFCLGTSYILYYYATDIDNCNVMDSIFNIIIPIG